MKLTNIFSMLGGLALFLYGMNMMSNGLELAAGNKMKSILEKLTSNRILGVLVGALVTAVIQSSSATTLIFNIVPGVAAYGSPKKSPALHFERMLRCPQRSS